MDPFAAFLAENPDIQMLEAFVVDLNGTARGKRLPVAQAGKVFKGGFRLPRSAFALDVWGQDVLAAGMVTETGDTDGVCRPVLRTLRRAPWISEAPAAQVFLSMEDKAGRPFFADPRHVLAKVLSLYTKKGWTPVVAAELEFYMLDSRRDERGNPQPPCSPRTGRRASAGQVYGIGEVAEYGPALADIGAACVLQGIPADATISENGPGQFEINLLHVPDALLAADHAVALKRAVRGAARARGLDATFMAKPYAGCSGNGMHVHFSVLDRAGKNIFAGRGGRGSPALRHAIGGLLAALPDSTAVYAPNFNSYRRFAAGTHAPTNLSWGYDNRQAALRVPDSDDANTRIEHRVGGADVNPHLALAVMLAAAYDGLVKKTDPGPPAGGNAYAAKKAARLPATWGEALAAFESSAFIAKYLGRPYRKVYLACKRQEKAQIEAQVSSLEYDAYLRDI